MYACKGIWGLAAPDLAGINSVKTDIDCAPIIIPEGLYMFPIYLTITLHAGFTVRLIKFIILLCNMLP
jgi:hypothetical protein